MWVPLWLELLNTVCYMYLEGLGLEYWSWDNGYCDKVLGFVSYYMQITEDYPKKQVMLISLCILSNLLFTNSHTV